MIIGLRQWGTFSNISRGFRVTLLSREKHELSISRVILISFRLVTDSAM